MVRACHAIVGNPPNASAGSSADAAVAILNPPKSATASGLVQGVLEGQDEDGDDNEGNVRQDLNNGHSNDGKGRRLH